MEQQIQTFENALNEPPSAYEKKWVLGLYITHGFTLFFTFGLLSFIPLILNYIKKEDAGSFLLTHHRWQIRSFWWFFLWLCVAGILILSVFGSLIGIAIWGLAWLWKAYRLLKGIIYLNEKKPMPL